MRNDNDNNNNENDNKNYVISYGGVREVTGSMHLLHLDLGKDLGGGDDSERFVNILLDCGAFQEIGADDKNSYLPDSIDVSRVDYVFLTHGHYDHCGRLPIIYQRGFRGKIICTKVTRDIVFRVLDDNYNIQCYKEERGERKLFETEDLEGIKSLFDTGGIGEDFPVWKNSNGRLVVRFISSEHIIGSASIFVEKPIRFLYTGDLGGGRSSLHDIPRIGGVEDGINEIDYLMIESTYGNRILEKSDVVQLINAIDYIKQKKGKLLIACLSIGRVEEILFLLRQLEIKEKVYLDTPMGGDILDIYSNNKFLLKKIADKFGIGTGTGSGANDIGKIFRPLNFERIESRKRSMELVKSKESCIIIASSGMLEGGRIISHLTTVLGDERNILMFTGYQVIGTLGRRILDGEKEIKIWNEGYSESCSESSSESSNDDDENDKSRNKTIKVKCEIRKIDGLSSHIDKDGIMEYINGIGGGNGILPSKIFVVHGELESSLGLGSEIEKRFRVRTVVPKYNTKYYLDDSSVIEEIKIKDVSNIDTLIEKGLIKFDSIGRSGSSDRGGKKIGAFAGWIVDNGDNYTLVGSEDIQNVLREYLDIDIGGDIGRVGIDRIEIEESKDGIDRNGDENSDKNKVEMIGDIDDEDIKLAEISNIMFYYFKEGYISKGLIKGLVNSLEKGMSEYRSTLEKRIKGGDLILDDIELEKRGHVVDKERRDSLEKRLGDILARSTKLDNRSLLIMMKKLRDEVKDM